MATGTQGTGGGEPPQSPWTSIPLRTPDRTLAGAWANLNAAIGRALALAFSGEPSPPQEDANLFSCTNGSASKTLSDGTLLMMGGDGTVVASTGAVDAICVGAAEGDIGPAEVGRARNGGLKSIPMASELADLAAGQPVYVSVTTPGFGTTDPADALGSAIGVTFDTTIYSAVQRCVIELMLKATPPSRP